jgi:hypothetical protein
MRLHDMNREVTEDLRHIARGATGSAQRLLRALYVMIRRHDLSKTGASRHASLAEAIADVRRFQDSAFVPEYNRAYFA